MIAWAAMSKFMPALALVGAVASFGAGWYASATLAENAQLRAAAQAAKAFADATERANAAAADYVARRDAIEPQIRIVRVQADPIVRELVSCPMPIDAGRLLERAANLADGRHSDTGNAAGTAPASGRPGDSRRSVSTGD